MLTRRGAAWRHWHAASDQQKQEDEAEGLPPFSEAGMTAGERTYDVAANPAYVQYLPNVVDDGEDSEWWLKMLGLQLHEPVEENEAPQASLRDQVGEFAGQRQPLMSVVLPNRDLRYQRHLRGGLGWVG